MVACCNPLWFPGPHGLLNRLGDRPGGAGRRLPLGGGRGATGAGAAAGAALGVAPWPQRTSRGMQRGTWG